MRPDVEAAAAVSVGWGISVAVGGYAVLRGLQSFLWPDPNPATLAAGVHSGFFWRIWTVSYAGGIAAFVVLVLGRAAAVRGLPYAVGVASALLGLQALFFP